jgi:hypothetical protein
MTLIREKQVAIFLLEVVAIATMLASLSCVAIPHAAQMVNSTRAQVRETELEKVQAAVAEMLVDSTAGALEAVGPTSDLIDVHTRDIPPLVLKDYFGKNTGRLGGIYGFTSDGTVVLLIP